MVRIRPGREGKGSLEGGCKHTVRGFKMPLSDSLPGPHIVYSTAVRSSKITEANSAASSARGWNITGT